MSNKKTKILNDPVYGFIEIPSGIIRDIIDMPVFQRLRRVRQLGLSHLVYPGAQHTRFQHVIGAMSLTIQAVHVLRSKGVAISLEEEEAVSLAVLLHDIGHGPFSHTLEHELIQGVSHEDISLRIMQDLNETFSGKLALCLAIYSGTYPRKFLHQLVSSQLDMDRLDYLRRDSFYTGVQEGVVGNDRIIHMLNVHQDELVVDEKGIYSVEKFLVARRLMYWQVYLHKTVVAAEHLLIHILRCARQKVREGEQLFASPAFERFLTTTPTESAFVNQPDILKAYLQLDDEDIMTSIKVWCSHSDPVLSRLCRMLVDRKLPKIELSNNAFDEHRIEKLKQQVAEDWGIPEKDSGYFVFSDSIRNNAYNVNKLHIQILYKNGETRDIATASDLENIETLGATVTKYFLCYPKNMYLAHH